MAVGVKIRSRIQDCVANERISKYIIAKQKEIARKKIINSMTDNNGNLMLNFADIKEHVYGFYGNLYSKVSCDNEKQDYFLSFFLHNGLSDQD